MGKYSRSEISWIFQGQSFEGNNDCVVSGWGEIGWNQGGPNVLQALEVEVCTCTVIWKEKRHSNFQLIKSISKQEDYDYF